MLFYKQRHRAFMCKKTLGALRQQHAPCLGHAASFQPLAGQQRQLLLPLGRIVAAINLDTVAVAPRGAPVTIVGRGHTGLDGLIDATARRLGRRVDGSNAAEPLVKRQDGWALLQKGVPAVMIGGAYGPPLQRFFATRYHQPSDEADRGLELGGAAEDVTLLIALGTALADPARYPTSARAVFAERTLDSPAAPH